MPTNLLSIEGTTLLHPRVDVEIQRLLATFLMPSSGFGMKGHFSSQRSAREFKDNANQNHSFKSASSVSTFPSLNAELYAGKCGHLKHSRNKFNSVISWIFMQDISEPCLSKTFSLSNEMNFFLMLSSRWLRRWLRFYMESTSTTSTKVRRHEEAYSMLIRKYDVFMNL